MDLNLTPAETAFRDEVSAFLKAALPEPIRLKHMQGETLSKEDHVTWARILNRRGWVAPRWPIQFGGTGWSPIEHYIFEEQMQAAWAPEPFSAGLGLVGPVIYTFGSEAQKEHYLPRIRNFDDWWAQGFSEPGAGSDLASLKTSAQRQGDVYVVNGQKTWTTLGQYANWIFCLVRTDPAVKQQEGISFLLIDMASPGITVRPIITIEGGHEVNEVFFDDVQVPLDNRVGAENKGWHYAKYLLGAERTTETAVGIGRSKQQIRLIKRLAASELSAGKPLIESERFREKMALLEAELKALEITQLRVICGARNRHSATPDPVSSILKLKGSEIQQAITELMLDVAGPYVLPFRSQTQRADARSCRIGPDFAAVAAPTYFNWRKATIYSGSSEIQRNIIAKTILGL